MPRSGASAAWVLAQSQAMRSPRSRKVSKRAMGTCSSRRTSMLDLFRWRAIQSPVVLEILDPIRFRHLFPRHVRILNVLSDELLHRAGARNKILFEPVEDSREIGDLALAVETIPARIIDKFACRLIELLL